MKTSTWKSISLTFFLAALAAFGTPSLAAPLYILTDLGTLGESSNAYAINDHGQVVGQSRTDAGLRAFLYDGSIHDLGTLGGNASRGRDINNAGQIVGESNNSNDEERPFLYQGGVMHDLGTLGGPSGSAEGMNNAGQIVGGADNADNQTIAFMYESGTMYDLDPVDNFSRAFDINNAGQIVGVAQLDFSRQAFLYENGIMHSLGTLGGQQSRAYGINDAGQIVGESWISGDIAINAFLYENGVMHDLGRLAPTDFSSTAYAINNAGQIVGASGDIAFLYEGGAMIDLNTLVELPDWSLLEARDINEHGQIVGTGIFDGQARAFLLTPIAEVPEPPIGLLLLGAALAWLGVRKRRA